MHYTIDGCINKYRCSNIMWLLFVLAFTWGVIIDICMDIPGRGRGKIDGICESDNKYLKQKMCMICTKETNS